MLVGSGPVDARPAASCHAAAARRATARARPRAHRAPRPGRVPQPVRGDHERRRPRPAAQAHSSCPSTTLAVDPANGARVVHAAARPSSACASTPASRAAGCSRSRSTCAMPATAIVSRFVTHLVVADVDRRRRAHRRPPRSTWRGCGRCAPTPRTCPTASPDPTVLAELLPAGRLGRQASLLGEQRRRAAHPRPESRRRSTPGPTLSLREPRPRGRSCRSIVGSWPRNQMLAGPFVPLDLPSLLAGGVFTGAIPDEFARGVSTRSRQLVRAASTPAPRCPARSTPPSLAALRNAPACAASSSRARHSRASTSSSRAPDPFTLQPDPRRRVDRDDRARQRRRSRALPRAATSRRRCAPRASSPASRSSRASSPTAHAASTLVNPARWEPAGRAGRAAARRAARQPAAATGHRRPAPRPRSRPRPSTTSPTATRSCARSSPTRPPAPPVTASRYYDALVERDAVARLFPADRRAGPARQPRPARARCTVGVERTPRGAARPPPCCGASARRSTASCRASTCPTAPR